jgi:hypothetical protein
MGACSPVRVTRLHTHMGASCKSQVMEHFGHGWNECMASRQVLISGIGKALLGADCRFGSEPVIHIMPMGKSMILMQEVGTQSHRLNQGNKRLSRRRGMNGFAVGGFAVVRLRAVTWCFEIVFHTILIIPSRPRFDHGVFTPWSQCSSPGMLIKGCPPS